MSTNVYDPEGFGRALKKLVEGEDSPYVHMATAKRHMEETSMHALTYGALGEVLVKGDYDEAREYLTGELGIGFENLRATIGGLNQVAANNAGAEQANMIDPDEIVLPKAEPPGDVPLVKFWNAGNEDNRLEGGVLYASTLGALSRMTLPITQASAGLARGAGIAVALWLSYIPDDDEINRAYSHWTMAGTELYNARTQLVHIGREFGDSWTGPAKEAFEGYVEDFAAELEELENAIFAGATRMNSCQTTLGFFQHFAFLQAITCLVCLAVLEITSWTPPTNRPAVKAAMESLGLFFSYSTVGIFAMITLALKDWLTAVIILAFGAFVTEKTPDPMNKEKNGVDFKEVELSKEELEKLVSDAGSS